MARLGPEVPVATGENDSLRFLGCGSTVARQGCGLARGEKEGYGRAGQGGEEKRPHVEAPVRNSDGHGDPTVPALILVWLMADVSDCDRPFAFN